MLTIPASSRNELLRVIAIFVLSAGIVNAEPNSNHVSGNLESFLAEELPDAPPGFSTTREVLQAITKKQIRPIDQATTFPDVELKRNVSYSNAAGERGVLDLYKPRDGKSPRIGLILVHGGGWRGGSKEDYRYYGQQFAHRGMVAVCINYRLAPQGRFPTQIQDVKCAIRWMRANAEQLNIDPDRIAIMGGSAGGHLSLLAAYATDVAEFENVGGHDGVSSEVQAVIDIYGPTDFTKDFAKADKMVPGLIRDFLGKTQKVAASQLEIASPLTHLDRSDPPTLIFHGTIDSLVPIAQSDRLAAKLKEIELPYVYDRIEGWSHGMDIAKPVNERVLLLVEKFIQHTLMQDDVSESIQN